jgi:hypothetical protein
MGWAKVLNFDGVDQTTNEGDGTDSSALDSFESNGKFYNKFSDWVKSIPGLGALKLNIEGKYVTYMDLAIKDDARARAMYDAVKESSNNTRERIRKWRANKI